MKCPICHKFLSYTDADDYNRSCRGHIYVRTKKNQIIRYKFICRDTPDKGNKGYIVEGGETSTFMYYVEIEGSNFLEECVIHVPKHIPLTVKNDTLQADLIEDKLRTYLTFS